MPPTNEPQQPQSNQGGPQPLRTFQGDVEQMIKEGNGSLSKIAIAENDKRNSSAFVGLEPEKPKHAGLLVGASLGLILIGAGVVFAIFYFRTPDSEITKNNEPRPILIADSQKNLNISGLSRDQIIKALVNQRDLSSSNLSAVEAIVLTEGAGELATPVSAVEFLSKIKSHAPSELVRSLDSSFMFGIHVLSKRQPFLVLKTNYYQNAFTGMLAWEDTLKDDLGPIFIYPQTLEAASTSANLLIKNTTFQDAVVKNRDTRVLRGADGKINFLYSFPDKDTLIITTNSDTLEQVISKLSARKLVQ